MDVQAQKRDSSSLVKFFLDERRKVKLVPIKLPKLVERFLADIRAREKSRRYILDMQARLHTAGKSFTGFIADVRAPQIDEWLASMKDTGGRTKNNYRMALITLFSFARQKSHLPRGQQTEAEFSARYNDKGGEIGIYTPEQLEILLSRIEPRLVPFVAIGAFAGLRSAEIVRLEWKEVRFDQDFIEIKAAKAKTASRRLVPILPSLKAWLNPLCKETGKVLAGVSDEFALAKQFRNAVSVIRDDDGKQLVKIVHNGLRHSFITYRMAILKNAAEVALEARNSPRMIFEHYRELTTAKQATAWFSTLPDPARSGFLTTPVAFHGQSDAERSTQKGHHGLVFNQSAARLFCLRWKAQVHRGSGKVGWIPDHLCAHLLALRQRVGLCVRQPLTRHQPLRKQRRRLFSAGTAAPSETPMIDHIQEVQINIDSPSGSVFRGFGKAVVIKAKKQVIIEFRRNWVNYVSLSEHAEMTVEIGNGCRRFLLKNAMARLDREKLSILAETITSPHKKPPRAH